MKHYAVAEITVTDRAWARAYVDNVTPLVEQFGGRYLARTSNIDILESSGHVPQMILIIEWPSKELALAFYESEEYRPYRESRQAGSNGGFFLVPAEDINGAARIS